MSNEAAASPSAEVLDYLRREGREVAAAEGDLVVRRGEQGVAFWAVLEGMVEVRLTGEDGVHLPLARMGAGATFGEMSLISGEPVSADVVALSAVRLLRYPAASFARAMGEYEPLRRLVLSGMAANLRGTSAEVWNFYQQAKALNVLMDPRRAAGPVVADSSAMKPVREAIAARAGDREPVLICGASGSGKLFVAAKIHEAAGRSDAPFIAVDCRTLDRAEAMRFLFGSDAGIARGERSRDGAALRRYGALQLAHGGTLVLRHPRVLPEPVQEAIGRYLQDRSDGAIDYPATRVVATSDRAPAELPAALAAALCTSAVLVPSLHQRRRDIVPLARQFLAERAALGAKQLSRSAEHALLSQRYAHRNAAELREAIEMAAVISDEPVIRAEHIFTGPKGEGSVREIELTSIPLVRRLIAPRFLGAARAVVLASFAAVIVCALRGSGVAGRFANAATWSLWEPGLIVAFLLLGRVWCTVCPLSTAGSAAGRLGGLGLAPGAHLKKHSGWLIIGGYLLIVMSEHAFRMPQEPRATAGLLIGLLGAAVASAVVWKRETWCRYLCPLGNLGAVFSLPAVLTVRSNPSVCATMCTTHECFKGSPSSPGCPVFHHPLYACESQACKLCFQCLRVCPHGSARLYLRLPLQSIWAQSEVTASLVPFALFVLFFSPAMLASQGSTWAATRAGFAGGALLALAAAAGGTVLLPRLLSAGADPDPALAARVSFALLVLAWGPAMAFQIGRIDALGALHLQADPGSALAAVLPAGGASLLEIAQRAAVAAAGALAAVCFAGLRGAQRRRGEAPAGAGWVAVLGIAALYEAAALALAFVD